MANEYEKIVRKIRREVSKLTLEQQRQLLNIYEDAIKELSRKAIKAREKSLTKRWVTDYLRQLESVQRELRSQINKTVREGIEKAAELGTEPEQQIMRQIFQLAEIDIGDHFTTIFGQVRKKVVHDIISGNLYKDSRTISARIWQYSREFSKDIQYTINQALLQKKSAIELAKDLEQFVKEPAKRETTWGKVYPNLKNKKVDYNAMRLARTSINHAYQTSTIQSSNINPFVEGIEWQSALIHGRTCELCRERHGQIFPKDKVPLDHPNGLCSMLPVISKSLDEVEGELRSWLDGENNSKLDKWYNEYGKHFI